MYFFQIRNLRFKIYLFILNMCFIIEFHNTNNFLSLEKVLGLFLD